MTAQEFNKGRGPKLPFRTDSCPNGKFFPAEANIAAAADFFLLRQILPLQQIFSC
jgi:hypothetical protein